jgi:Flp pilus assembly protein TadB
MQPRTNIDEILRKHGSRIESQIKAANFQNINFSREYVTFKNEMAPELTRYERWCASLGSIIKLRISEKDRIRIQKDSDIAHLEIEPWQSLTLSMMSFISVLFLGILISVAIALIKGSIAEFPLLFFFLIVMVSIFLFSFMNGYPRRLANKWRLKASSQMVPAVLYVVVYMRHTPNLEKAIAFASEHLQYPLALDFKKIFYNVEVGKFSTIKESLDNYLETWRDYSAEFIESFHLIESSLFESSDAQRIISLEKALQVVLDGVYDKMLGFTHEVRSPLTNVYMLGVVLPTLGLALLPLASAMLGGMILWYHIFLLFNILVPFLVFYLTDKILMLRPGGYGETELLEKNPLYPKYKSKKPYFAAFLVCLPFFIIGLLPLIFQFTPLPNLIGIQNDYTFAELGLGFFGEQKLLDFKQGTEGITGPFGFGALFCSLFLPLGIALFFSLGAKSRTKSLIIERRKTRDLENEFNSSLFQLGNRIGNGVPPEIAFGKIAESTKGLKTQDFFSRVSYNIRQMGMGVEKAIFDSQRGAIIFYPSDLIATSMKVLIESSKKGLKIAALSLMSISEYVKNIQKITNRLRDMLAEIISDMKSNMTFLAPLLSGIVVGLSVMIVGILNKLTLPDLGGDVAGIGNFSELIQIFDLSKMIPPYYLQISIGIYLIQIIFILTSSLVTIDSGEDKLEKTNKTGKNLMHGITLYFITALIASVALFFLASMVLGNM